MTKNSDGALMKNNVAVYLHGIPGSGAELNLFGTDFAANTDHFFVPKRLDISGTTTDAWLANLAKQIVQHEPRKELYLTGFSIGAALALRLAPLLGDRVVKIDLVSAAAPLGLGDYLGSMAGKPVFDAAKSGGLHFTVLTRMQSLVAWASPLLLCKMLLASAQGDDRALMNDDVFLQAMCDNLQTALGDGLDTYRRELSSYVEDWRCELENVSAPVELYHGTADNWSPVQMAHDLAGALPNCVGLNLYDGASHYTALKEYLAR